MKINIYFIRYCQPSHYIYNLMWCVCERVFVLEWLELWRLRCDDDDEMMVVFNTIPFLLLLSPLPPLPPLFYFVWACVSTENIVCILDILPTNTPFYVVSFLGFYHFIVFVPMCFALFFIFFCSFHRQPLLLFGDYSFGLRVKIKCIRISFIAVSRCVFVFVCVSIPFARFWFIHAISNKWRCSFCT